jgi:hypothetical protein
MILVKWLDSLREEWLRKKEEDEELVDLYEEVIRRFYIGPGME